MKVIALSAKSKHGKDFTAKYMKSKLESMGERVLITHFADLLKYICENFFDWDGKKDEYGRTLLQHVGTDIIRQEMPDYWVDFIISILKLFPNEWDYILIPDARFPNEIEKMKENFDTISVKIFRQNFTNDLTEEQQNHSSETALDDYKFDYILINDGHKTYKEKIDLLLMNIMRNEERSKR